MSKNVFINKTAEAVVKTSSAVTNSTKTLIRSSKDMAVNSAVNYTPDFYDQHQDYSEGATKVLIGSTAMTARTGVRMTRNVRAIRNKKRMSLHREKIKNQHRKMAEYKKEYDTLKEQHEALQKTISDSKSGIKDSGISNSYMKSRVKKANAKKVDLNKKMKRSEFKQKRLTKKQKNLNARKFKLGQSVKQTTMNQTRKLASTVKSKDDFGSKTIGYTMKGVWATKKYGRYAKSASQKIVALIKKMFTSVITFVSSIPAIVTSVVTLIPFIIVICVISVVICCFSSSTYTGRIGTLYNKISDLKTIYEVDLDPAEILAITDVLEWTTQGEEEYEQLVSIMLDQKKGNKLTFEQMATNVFIKYNPANKYAPNGVYSDEMDTGLIYYSLEGLDINFIVGNPVKRKLRYKEHVTLYPLYRDGNTYSKKSFGDSKKQKEQIKKAKSLIETNRQRYEDYIYEYNLGDVDLDITGDNEKGIAIAKKALTKLGCKYIWGAGHGSDYKKTDCNEFDCSGLVNWTFYQFGIDLGGATTSQLVKMGQEVPKNKIQAGDIIVYYNSSAGEGHVVICIGNNKVVHAPYPGQNVQTSEVKYFINEPGAHVKRLY